MWLSWILGLLFGALVFFLLNTKAGQSIVALLQNAQALLPAAKGLSFSEMQSLLPLLPEMEPNDVHVLSKQMPVLQPHIRTLIPALPALKPHFRLLMMNMSVLVPRLDKLIPLLPQLTSDKQTADCLPFLLEQRVLTVLLDHIDDVPESTMKDLPELLPVVAPFLAEMVDRDCLDLCIYRAETLAPLVKEMKGKPEFVGMMPLLISRAKALLPYSERLVPFAGELIGFSGTLLSDENWALLEPHLESLLEIFPLLRKHLKELVENIDVLLPHMNRLAPKMFDLAQHADKLIPHARKLAPHCDALMDHWEELSPHLPVLLEEIDVLVLYIDDLVPQLPYLAPHIGEIVPVISKTAKYTPYLLADYGGITKYVHHVLSIPGAAQLLPTLGAFAQQWHELIDPKQDGDKKSSVLVVGDEVIAVAPGGNDNNKPEVPAAKSVLAKDRVSSSPPSPSSSMLKRNQVAVSGIWEPDNARDSCFCCNAQFTFTRRRHHCRVCGRLVCGSCSQNLIVTKALGEAPVRSCDKCSQQTNGSFEKL